jgi:ketosteroid isomerase-like protein
MARGAKETIEEFWRIQDAGDYTALVDLFAEDAVVTDPKWGTYRGREAIRGFMETMNREMTARKIDFIANEIAGDGEVAWAQWTARTPAGDIEGCGVYRVRDGLLSYYKDYMNSPAPG